jgi:tetratricopeptide (TPR) repeat protein
MSTKTLRSQKVQQEQLKSKRKSPADQTRLSLPVFLCRAILVLGCFMLFLPVIVNYNFYSPYIFFKSILFRSIVQAMVFLYTALAVVSPSHRPKFNRIHFGLLAYIGVMFVCSLPGLSINAWDSWWGEFTRMGGMLTQLHLLAYFLVLSQTFRKERDWTILFTASLFSATCMGLTGLNHNPSIDLFSHFDQQNRLQGTTGNATFFASYMLLNLLLVLHFLARKDRKELYPDLAKVWLFLLVSTDVLLILWDTFTGSSILSAGLNMLPVVIFALVLHGASLAWFAARRKTWAGFSFLSVLCLFFLFLINESQSRAVIGGLAASLLFVALLYAWKGAGKRTKWAAVLMILLLGLVPLAIWHNRHSGWVANNPLLNRLTTTSLTERRFTAWHAVSKGILDHPVLGWGLENYNNAFDLHAPARLFFGEVAENWDDRAHNVLLDVGTTTGVAGLLVYLCFYGIVFRFLTQSWFKTKSTNHLLFSGLLLGYLVQNLFTFDTINTDVVLFLVLAHVAYLYRRPEPELSGVPAADRVQSSITGNGLAILASTAVVLVLCFSYFVKWPHDANLLLNSGIVLETDKGLPQDGAHYLYRESIVSNFEQADKYGATGRHQVREEFANYASEVVRASYIPVQDRAKAARKAIDFLEESIREDPCDARHYMYLASMANAAFPVFNQSDPRFALSMAERALFALKKAESFGPNRPRLLLERAQALANLGRTDEAIQSLRRAIEIDSGLRAARFDLVALCISAGYYQEAQKEWQTIRTAFPPTATDYDRMIAAYVSKKYLEPVVDLYKEQLRISPDNPEILAHLAAVYRELGDMESARNNALKAAALSPGIAAQLQEFLKTLKK